MDADGTPDQVLMGHPVVGDLPQALVQRPHGRGQIAMLPGGHDVMREAPGARRSSVSKASLQAVDISLDARVLRGR